MSDQSTPGSGKGSPPGGLSEETVMKAVLHAFGLSSAHKDYKESTTRNTTTTVTGIGAGMVGAAAGSQLEAAISGPLGAVVGCVVGGDILGRLSKEVATDALNAVADKAQYDMADRSCDTCDTQFLARVYLGETKCKQSRGGQ